MGTLSGSYKTGYTLYGSWLGTYGTPGGDGFQILNGAQFTLFKSATVTGGQGATKGSNGGIGIYLNGGAHTPTLINNGIIAGGNGNYGGTGGTGVYAHGATLNNDGYIYGGSGGFETTQSGAGGIGVDLLGGTFTNQGTIGGGYGAQGGAGVALDGGLLTNDGYIRGGVCGSQGGGTGVSVDGGTLINDGLISGGNGSSQIDTAVQFGASAGTLVVDPGATFWGYVTANPSVNDTLQLTGTESAGAQLYIGLPGLDAFKNFQTLNFAAGAAWTVLVNYTNVPLNIDDFAASDHIYMSHLTPLQVARDFGVSYTALGGGALKFNGSAGGETLTNASYGTLHFGGDFSDDAFLLMPSGGGTEISQQPVCFLCGTQIRTLSGDTAVEDLRVGEPVLTASGQARPIRWIGSRGLDCTRHPKPGFVWPICIQAGAFAEGLPARDLWVSPFHSLLVEGVLVQAVKLLNGATIVQVPCERVEYWHVELEDHDILLAEGLPAESYLDVGNRSGFACPCQGAGLCEDRRYRFACSRRRPAVRAGAPR